MSETELGIKRTVIALQDKRPTDHSIIRFSDLPTGTMFHWRSPNPPFMCMVLRLEDGSKGYVAISTAAPYADGIVIYADSVILSREVEPIHKIHISVER